MTRATLHTQTLHDIVQRNIKYVCRIFPHPQVVLNLTCWGHAGRIIPFQPSSTNFQGVTARTCRLPAPQHRPYSSPPSSPSRSRPHSCRRVQVFLLSARRDTLTRNGLRCFPAPVNRLPACEGIDGFDIRCCLTQKRRGGPRDGPFLTLHIHHAGQSNEWDTGAPPREAEQSRNTERKRRGKGEGVRFPSPSPPHPPPPSECRWG